MTIYAVFAYICVFALGYIWREAQWNNAIYRDGYQAGHQDAMDTVDQAINDLTLRDEAEVSLNLLKEKR